jgi:rRNA-processing protein FCF1
MKVLITDANIFIDLILLDLLPDLFSLGFKIHTTFAVLNELSTVQQNLVEKSGSMLVHTFDSLELAEMELLKCTSALSFTDRTVLYVAMRIESIVFTGDKPLRRELESRDIEVHGIIWFFERCVAFDLLTREIAAIKLSKLLVINPRLPTQLIQKRINEWRIS